MRDDLDDIIDIINASPQMVSDKQKRELLDLYQQMNMKPEQPQCPPRKTDAQLREECPAVKDAWNQYKMVLKLARTEEAE